VEALSRDCPPEYECRVRGLTLSIHIIEQYRARRAELGYYVPRNGIQLRKEIWRQLSNAVPYAASNFQHWHRRKQHHPTSEYYLSEYYSPEDQPRRGMIFVIVPRAKIVVTCFPLDDEREDGDDRQYKARKIKKGESGYKRHKEKQVELKISRIVDLLYLKEKEERDDCR